MGKSFITTLDADTSSNLAYGGLEQTPSILIYIGFYSVTLGNSFIKTLSIPGMILSDVLNV